MFRLHAPLICRLLSVVRCETLLFPVSAFCRIRLMPGARPGIGLKRVYDVRWDCQMGSDPDKHLRPPVRPEYPTPVSVYRSLSMESR